MAGDDAMQDAGFKVILASASPRREELLKDVGMKFIARKPSTPVDETLDPDLLIDPIEAAKNLAEKKAGAVMQDLLSENPAGNFVVLGADTMVVLDGAIYGKPRGLEDAKRMLRELSGKTHQVITAVSVWMLMAPESDKISMAYRTFADVSRVTFKTLDDETIADYLKKGESFDKAGAYAIQGEGANLIEGYEGDLDTIIGLPVNRLLREFPDLRNAE